MNLVLLTEEAGQGVHGRKTNVSRLYDLLVEDVKKPILQQIFKDKTHPCWADTAWILDVTGELPKAK